MKKSFRAVITAIFMLLAVSMAVSSQGYYASNATANASQVNTTVNATNATAPYSAPGFEFVFVITGMISAAYLVLIRKQ
jgi:hypothetical protein